MENDESVEVTVCRSSVGEIRRSNFSLTVGPAVVRLLKVRRPAGGQLTLVAFSGLISSFSSAFLWVRWYRRYYRLKRNGLAWPFISDRVLGECRTGSGSSILQ